MSTMIWKMSLRFGMYMVYLNQKIKKGNVYMFFRKTVIILFGSFLAVCALSSCSSSYAQDTNRESANMTSEEESKAVTVEYAEDAVLLQSSSGERQKTVYSYDENGRLCEAVSLSLGDDGIWTATEFDNREYDDRGNLISHWIRYCNENGDFIENGAEAWYYQYSEDNRLSGYVYYPKNGGDVSGTVYEMRYDTEGRLVEEYGEKGDGNSVYNRYSYEDGSTLASSKYHSSSNIVASTKKTEYTYDEQGNCIEELILLQYKEDWKYFEKIVRSFDEKGNLLEETCYGNDGDMALNPDLSIEYLNVKWSIEQHDLYNYDENGHLLVSIENDRRSGRSKKSCDELRLW